MININSNTTLTTKVAIDIELIRLFSKDNGTVVPTEKEIPKKVAQVIKKVSPSIIHSFFFKLIKPHNLNKKYPKPKQAIPNNSGIVESGTLKITY